MFISILVVHSCGYVFRSRTAGSHCDGLLFQFLEEPLPCSPQQLLAASCSPLGSPARFQILLRPASVPYSLWSVPTTLDLFPLVAIFLSGRHSMAPFCGWFTLEMFKMFPLLSGAPCVFLEKCHLNHLLFFLRTGFLLFLFCWTFESLTS